jgi:hypothetical protein
MMMPKTSKQSVEKLRKIMELKKNSQIVKNSYKEISAMTQIDEILIMIKAESNHLDVLHFSKMELSLRTKNRLNKQFQFHRTLTKINSRSIYPKVHLILIRK